MNIYNENYDSFLTLSIMVNDPCSLTYYVAQFCPISLIGLLTIIVPF